MRVEQLLDDSAAQHAKRAAIICGGRSYTYAALVRASDRVAAALLARGITRGDRVALYMDDSYEAVVATFAVLKAGAVAVPIDADSSAAEVGAMLRRAAAVAFIVEARLASAAAAAMSSWTSVRLVLLRGGDPATSTPCCLVFEEIASGIGAAPQIDRPGPASDPALRMRAVADPADAVLTHADVIAAAGSSGERTRHLSAILSFQGMCGIVAAVRAGATLVLETPSVFRRALSAHADNDAVPALAG